MSVRASAPGKLVLLGEYAVLDGAKALVMAVNRRCIATLGLASDAVSNLTTRMPDPQRVEFSAGGSSGSALIDVVRQHPELRPPWDAWAATIDSSAFFEGGAKLGIGSSAAALVAFAGAAWAAAGKPAKPPLRALVECHRTFQGGSGSGVDVAAALTGGCLEFTLNSAGEAQTGSVQLPKSVAFAGIFAGASASTPDLVGQYRRWADSGSAQAAEARQRLARIAAEGCAAVATGDGRGFLASIDAYGRCLGELGRAVGADIVTAAHQQIGELAGRFGLAYKVSGAGGGDVGIACGSDVLALRSFSERAVGAGFRVVPLAVDDEGLVVEEHAE